MKGGRLRARLWYICQNGSHLIRRQLQHAKTQDVLITIPKDPSLPNSKSNISICVSFIVMIILRVHTDAHIFFVMGQNRP